MEKIIILTLVYFYFCFDHLNVFKRVCKIKTDKKEQILAIRANLILSFVSLYYNYKFFQSGFNPDIYAKMLNNQTDLFILQLSSVFIISYFTMDCVIGKKHYHEQMTDITGYLHHVIYSFLSLSILNRKMTNVFLLYMIAEVPTFILNSGKYDKDFRNDYLFGATFFITRILYLVFLTFKFGMNDNFILISSSSAVLLHSYWFYKWCKKYLPYKNND